MVEVDGVQIIGVGFGAAHRKEQEQSVIKNLKINKLIFWRKYNFSPTYRNNNLLSYYSNSNTNFYLRV